MRSQRLVSQSPPWLLVSYLLLIFASLLEDDQSSHTVLTISGAPFRKYVFCWFHQIISSKGRDILYDLIHNPQRKFLFWGVSITQCSGWWGDSRYFHQYLCQHFDQYLCQHLHKDFNQWVMRTLCWPAGIFSAEGERQTLLAATCPTCKSISKPKKEKKSKTLSHLQDSFAVIKSNQ